MNINTEYNNLYNNCIETSRDENTVKFSFLDEVITAKCKLSKKKKNLKKIKVKINSDLLNIKKEDLKLLKSRVKLICREKYSNQHKTTPVIQEIFKRKLEPTDEASSKRSKMENTTGIGFGIVNGGNTCYLSAILQALRIQKLCVVDETDRIEQIMGLFPNIDSQNFKNANTKLYEIFEKLKTKEISGKKINALRNLLIDCGFDVAKNQSQVDASEAFILLSQILGLKPFHHFVYQSQLNNFGEANDEAVSLALSLDKSIQEQINTQFSFSDEELPDTFPIQLKRFNNQNQKIQTPMPHEPELTVKNIAGEEAKYDLCSVVVHKGTGTKNGHYYTYVKKNDNWYMFNDEVVNTCEQLKMEEDTACDGYLLFYNKR